MQVTKNRCPFCNSTQTRIRIMSNELACQSCGKISILNGDKKDGKHR